MKIENLIAVIKKHKVLYDTNNKDYYDRVKKKNVWEHVCATLNPDWDALEDAEKLTRYKEVNRKWQSLRDCFRRELMAQKTQSLKGKKKIKYKYFDALEFLAPFTHMYNSEAATFRNDDSESLTNIETSPNLDDPLSEDYEPVRKRKLSTAFVEDPAVTKEEYQEDSSNISRRFVDDDEAFLFSLLPSFKEYDQEQKFMLRIELMQTVLKFKQSQQQKSVTVVKEEVFNNDDVDYE